VHVLVWRLSDLVYDYLGSVVKYCLDKRLNPVQSTFDLHKRNTISSLPLLSVRHLNRHSQLFSGYRRFVPWKKSGQCLLPTVQPTKRC